MVQRIKIRPEAYSPGIEIQVHHAYGKRVVYNVASGQWYELSPTRRIKIDHGFVPFTFDREFLNEHNLQNLNRGDRILSTRTGEWLDEHHTQLPSAQGQIFTRYLDERVNTGYDLLDPKLREEIGSRDDFKRKYFPYLLPSEKKEAKAPKVVKKRKPRAN